MIEIGSFFMRKQCQSDLFCCLAQHPTFKPVSFLFMISLFHRSVFCCVRFDEIMKCIRHGSPAELRFHRSAL